MKLRLTAAIILIIVLLSSLCACREPNNSGNGNPVVPQATVYFN